MKNTRLISPIVSRLVYPSLEINCRMSVKGMASFLAAGLSLVVVAPMQAATPAATAADLTDTTGTVDYDLAVATGSTPSTVSANTINYTGGAATLAPGATSFTINGLTNSGTGAWTIGTSPIIIGANKQLAVQSNSQNITISSVIADSGTGKSSLIYNGVGRLTLSGANTYTGDTTLQTGLMSVTGANAIKGNLIVGASGGGAAASVSLSGDRTGSNGSGGGSTQSAVTVYSNGTLGISGNGASYIKDLTIVGGTVNLGGSAYLGVYGRSGSQSGTITMTGGTLGGGNPINGTIANVVTLSSASTATISVDNNAGIYGTATYAVADGAAAVDLSVTGKLNNGSFGGTTSNISKSGAGVMQVSGASVYTGNTTVSGGTLKAGVASVANVSGAFGKNSAVTLANTAGVTLDITGFNTQIGSLAGGGATGGIVTLGAATLTTGGKNTDTSFAGVISGTGGLTKIGTGTQTFTRANTYTGATTVSAGILNFGVVNAVSSSSDVVLSGGTLQSAFSQNLGTLSLTASSTLDLSTGGLFAFADSSDLAGSWAGTLSIIGTFTDGVSVRFGIDDLALTAGQLSQITINGFGASISDTGYLSIAVPEPSSYAAIFGSLALVCAAWRRRAVRR